MRAWALALGAAVACGCGTGGFPDVTEVRELSSSFGAPRIGRIRDVGGVRVPLLGGWKGESDGVAGPGELILIEGDNFGRQPTVSIGGRATSIVARTEGGGIVARVPVGVGVGDVEVAVSQPKGRDTRTLKVRRLALVAHADQLFVLEVSREGARPLGAPLPIPGARRVQISGDGSAAYVLAGGPGGDRIVVVDLAAAGGPKVSGERRLKHRAQMLSTADDAPVLAALGDGKVTILTLQQPRNPAAYDPTPLPASVKPPHAIEVSPDGKLLALLYPEGNKLSLLDLEHPPQVKLITTIDLLPGERLPLVRDLCFSADGETLWIVSGDSADTLPALQPTRLTAVRLPFAKEEPRSEGAQQIGSRLLSVWRTTSVPGAAAPLRVTVARGQPLASGTTIRMPPEKAAVFVTSLNDALFKLAKIDLDSAAGAKAALELWKPPQPGMMVRADINGGGGPLFATRELLSAVDLTPDAQLILATAARVSLAPPEGKVVLEFGLIASPIWGSPQPSFLPLGPLAASELKPPFELGDVKIQP
jgi:hypothetical protein